MKRAPWARRRAALKGRVLMGASIIMGDGEQWEVFARYAEELGLSDDALASVLEEVAAELWNRSVRLPSPEDL